jgi:hypothetical protein
MGRKVIKGKDNLPHKAHNVNIVHYKWTSIAGRSKRPIAGLSIRVSHEIFFGVKKCHLIFHGFDKTFKGIHLSLNK